MFPLPTLLPVDSPRRHGYVNRDTADMIGVGVCSAAMGVAAGATLPISAGALTAYTMCVAVPGSLIGSCVCFLAQAFSDEDDSDAEKLLFVAGGAMGGASLPFVPIVVSCNNRLNFATPIGDLVAKGTTSVLGHVASLQRWHQNRKQQHQQRVHSALGNAEVSSFGRVVKVSEIQLDE